MDALASPPPRSRMVTDEAQLNSVTNVQIIMTRLEWFEIYIALAGKYDRLEDRTRTHEDYMEWFNFLMKKFHNQI